MKTPQPVLPNYMLFYGIGSSKNQFSRKVVKFCYNMINSISMIICTICPWGLNWGPINWGPIVGDQMSGDRIRLGLHNMK